MPQPDNRRRVYAFLRSYFQQHQSSPSVREIAEALEVTPSTVQKHLDILERMGKIVRIPRQARGIRLVDHE